MDPRQHILPIPAPGSWSDSNVRKKLAEPGRAILSRFWKNIKKEICDWLRANSALSGTVLLAGLATQLANMLPAPMNGYPSVVMIIAAIIVKAGADTVCDPAKTLPPEP
jgi:hypothetical protein